MSEMEEDLSQTIADLRVAIKHMRAEIREVMLLNHACESENVSLRSKLQRARSNALKEAAEMAANHIGGEWTGKEIADAILALDDANG